MYQRVDHTTVYSYLLGEVGALYINVLDTVVLPVGGVHFLFDYHYHRGILSK